MLKLHLAPIIGRKLHLAPAAADPYIAADYADLTFRCQTGQLRRRRVRIPTIIAGTKLASRCTTIMQPYTIQQRS